VGGSTGDLQAGAYPLRGPACPVPPRAWSRRPRPPAWPPLPARPASAADRLVRNL